MGKGSMEVAQAWARVEGCSGGTSEGPDVGKEKLLEGSDKEGSEGTLAGFLARVQRVGDCGAISSQTGKPKLWHCHSPPAARLVLSLSPLPLRACTGPLGCLSWMAP